jgi:hypothetical protein
MARIVTSTYRYKRPPRKRKAATLAVPEMTARPVPARHWRCYGDAPLPTGREALDEPFAAFPSWFMRITCDRCGKDRMLNEAHMLAGNMTIRAIIAKMRHDGCGGRAGRVELLTGIEGASSRPVRKIVVLEGSTPARGPCAGLRGEASAACARATATGGLALPGSPDSRS